MKKTITFPEDFLSEETMEHLQELVNQTWTCFTNVYDDNWKLATFHIWRDSDYWYDKEVDNMMKEIPKEERENMIKIAKIRNLKKQIEQIEQTF